MSDSQGETGRAQPSHTLLSIVIPAYNEARRLPPNLRTLHAFLKKQQWEAITEVIVVDDGSIDGTTSVVKKLMPTWPRLRVLSLPHRGKGAAVRAGFLQASGDFIFFGDADFSMPITELPRFLPPLSPAVDIVIASREAPGARRFGEPTYRHLMGRIFNRLVQWLALPGINDSQCGFKCFTRAAVQAIAAAQTMDGMSFDVEMLALARLSGFTIAEIPIDWYHESDSRVNPIRDTVLMVRDVWHVRQRVRRASATHVLQQLPTESEARRDTVPAPVIVRHDPLND